jgi:hypothetical protein
MTGKGDEGGAKAADQPRAETGCSRSPGKRLGVCGRVFLEDPHDRGGWVRALSWLMISGVC